jgi:uncharacterized membrane protein YiaA
MNVNIKLFKIFARCSLWGGIVFFLFALLHLTGIFNRFWDGRISILAIGLASLMFAPKSYVAVMEAAQNRLGNPENIYLYARNRFGMLIAMGVIAIGIFVMIMLE